jgi:hypothetical protein
VAPSTNVSISLNMKYEIQNISGSIGLFDIFFKHLMTSWNAITQVTFRLLRMTCFVLRNIYFLNSLIEGRVYSSVGRKYSTAAILPSDGRLDYRNSAIPFQGYSSVVKKIVYALNRGDFTKPSPQVKSSYGNSQ